MKSFLTSLILICSSTAAMAQETADTITINKPDKVVITQSDNSLNVTIDGLPDESDFHLERSLAVADTTATTSFVNVDKSDPFTWNFSDAEKKGESKSTLEFGPNFELGFTTAIGGPDGMKTAFFKSGEFRADLMRINVVPAASRWSFQMEFGVAFSNYSLRGDRRFVADADNHLTIMPYPTDADKKKESHLLNFGGSIKLMAHYSVGKYSYIGFGPMWTIPAYNFGASCRTLYTDANGQKQSDMHRLDRQLSNVGFRFEYLPIHNFKVYATYQPWSSVSKQAFGNFSTLSLGIGFGF